MAFDPFLGKDLAWCQARISLLQDELAEAKRIISTGAGDTSAALVLYGTIESTLESLYAKAREFDPVTYSLDKTVIIDRTKATFSDL